LVSVLAFGGVVPIAVATELATASRASAALPSAVTDIGGNSVTSGTLFGGRGQHLTVDPLNQNVVYDASELGGIWKSTDGGAHWSHVDGIPLSASSDVQIASSDDSLIIAAGGYDGRVQSQGGVWRSTDGGNTWAKPANSDPSCTTEPSANRVSIAPGTPGALQVYVADSCGMSVSHDSGATWPIHLDPAGLFSNDTFYDVTTRVAGGNVQADACGNNGVYRSTDGGSTWVGGAPATKLFNGNINNLQPPCSVATAPQDGNTVFMASLVKATSFCSANIFESDDGQDPGNTQTWTSIAPSGLDVNCRAAWVKTHVSTDGNPNHFEIWFGDNSRTFHEQCDATATPRCGTSGWSHYDDSIRSVHKNPDSSDLAFGADNCPFLESGDGGIFKTADGCDSSPNFTASNVGLHALQATVLAGAVATSPAHADLYFGTQDNGIWVSNDGGGNWKETGPDVYTAFSDPTAPGNNVLWRDCCNLPGPPLNTFHVSDETFSGSPGSFNSPPGTNVPDSFLADQGQFASGFYVFATNDGAATPNWTIYVTSDSGSTWHQMGGTTPGQPQEIKVSGSAANPVTYVQTVVGNSTELYRLAGPISPAATYTEVDTGLNTPAFFAVHPTDPSKLYVVDTGLKQIMRSNNGGATWQSDPTLTSLVTGAGAFQFSSSSFGSQASAINFDANSNTVMVGTQTNGIYASADSGAHWIPVRGSQAITRTVGFTFNDNTGNIYAASAGRGIWQINLPTADLSITKTASPEPVVAGNQLTYTVTVSSDPTSASTAGSITVTDVLPSQVTFLTSNDGCVEGPPGTLTCPVPDLPPGASFSFTITTLVHSDTVVGSGGATTIVNNATVASGDTIDTNLANNTASASSTVVDSADLSVTKLCKPDTTIYAGTPINCTVFVDNHGPSFARNVVLDDTTLSNGAFTITNVAASAGACAAPVAVTGGQKLTCLLGDLANASTTNTGRDTVTYTITANDGQDINNVASVRSDTPDPDPTNNQATVNLTVTSLADLALTKNGPASVVAGTPISWTLSVQNNGPSTATNVAITDTVPAGVTITGVSMPGGSCVSGAAGDPTNPTGCSIGSLAAGATSTTMTVNATVNPQTTGVLENDARVSSDTFDNNSANDLAHTFTTVTVQSDVSVVIAATPNPVVAGTPLSYRLTVSNAGPSTATGVSVSDALPGGVTFSSTSGAPCGYQTNTNVVSCTLPNLDPGQSAVVFIYTMVKSSTLPPSISDAATASSASPDPNSANNSTTISTTVQTQADLGIVLTSDATVYKPSTTIHYNITVTNSGPSDAQNVVIVDNLPAVKQGKYVSNSLVGCPPPVGTTLTCSFTAVPSLVTLVAGGSITFQVNFFITGNKQTITSTASVTSATNDPNLVNNTSIRSVTVK
jgi:uncharacterized repeat protein (TIGR01451 family)